ncbi:hypothetical protein [Streptomyces shenzhenensis]|uniref:Uncharacterized protein n=1 Tax=Streptomyces shenzhenensis TaxID=943815 RepID=A0A3M0IHS2_9ACTN|nr:hypothetical protein [Streptomyces shenzhenensis]RMB87680.1 hypothetical protein CTZ28_01610 [Streptomyces shenzhenensis]
MPTTTPLPSATTYTLLDASRDWDAIRVPRSIGLAAMAVLGTRCGAVVEDRTVVYYFVPAGTAQAWDMENTRPLGTGASVTIPPARRTEGPGPHWRMCPGEDGWLTQPQALQAALEDCMSVKAGSEGSA